MAVYGGLIAIFIAIWIYRTALQAKTGNTIKWVAGSFAIYLIVQILMIKLNGTIIEFFDSDISSTYDNSGGLNIRDNSDSAGLQVGSGGTFIGIIFETIPVIVPCLVIALIRQKLMLKQPLGFTTLFSGIKEMFVAIFNSFKNVK